MEKRAFDQIRVTLELPLIPVDANDPSAGRYATFHLVINELTPCETFGDELFRVPANVYALRASARTSGKYPIFTCSCGDPGCNSIWVDCEVDKQASTVTWKAVIQHDDSGKPGRELTRCDYSFPIDEYRAVALAADEILEIYSAHCGPILMS